MYKVIEVKSITVVLSSLLVAAMLVATLLLGWLWGENRTLRAENRELMQASIQLAALVDKAAHSNNVLMERIATIGMGNMALMNHACGPKPVRDTTNMMEALNEFHGKMPIDPLSGMPKEMAVLPYFEEETTQAEPIAKAK